MKNQRRERPSLAEVLSLANRRAHDQANRRGSRRDLKSVHAAIAALDDESDSPLDWTKRMFRWLVAVVLLPLCWVTTWTFLSRFSDAAMERGFWQSTEFWYFATGMLLMTGWFLSGLLQSFFLYLYVLGHELTHAVFVLLHLGKVTDFHVSTQGGYITTNKTNLLIALSPYFVPFWSVVAVIIHMALRHTVGLPPVWDRVLYAVLGITWTFHMAWTLWMIPRDQPDLRENGTFLSLVIIYLANLLVLVALLCVAASSPMQSFLEFGMEWTRHTATWGDRILRWAAETLLHWRREARL